MAFLPVDFLYLVDPCEGLPEISKNGGFIIQRTTQQTQIDSMVKNIALLGSMRAPTPAPALHARSSQTFDRKHCPVLQPLSSTLPLACGGGDPCNSVPALLSPGRTFRRSFCCDFPSPAVRPLPLCGLVCRAVTRRRKNRSRL